MKNRKVAFTLAEVLVTLGIIGVVSAITMPTLVMNHQKQVLVNQLKSAYSIISNGVDRMMTDANAVTISETGLFTLQGDDLTNYLKKYFNVVSLGNDEYNDEYDVKEYLSCTSNSDAEYSCITTAISSEIHGIRHVLANGQWLYLTNSEYLEIDINGAKKPNVFGRDVFSFK